MSRHGDALPGPREWVGNAPYPWPPADGLRPGETVVACYSVTAVRPTLDARGATVIQLDLRDANGRVSAIVEAVEPLDWLRAGIYLGVRGTAESANGGQARIRVETLSPLRVELDELELFLPRTPRDRLELEAELLAAIDSVREPPLHALLMRLLGPNTETGRGFRLAPAATRNHHAYLGGLLEHTLSVTRLCDAMAAHYGQDVDRALLVTAALLHDIGKVREIGAQVGFPYTDEGRLLGHILLGLQMVEEQAARVRELEPARLMLLQHLIASHQGRYEWQSPREPRILEAIILHYVDDLDAKVHNAMMLLGAVDSGWTEYDRGLGRELLRHHSAPVAAPALPAKREKAQPLPGKPAAGRAKQGGAGAPRGARQKRANSKRKRGAKAQREAGRAGKARRAAAARRARKQNGAETASAETPAAFVDKDTLDLFA